MMSNYLTQPMSYEDFVLRKTLKLVRLFAGFSAQDARDFLSWAVRANAEPGSAIIREGEEGHELYVVVAGSLRVVRSGTCTEQELHLLQPGDSFGEIALLDSGPRSASVMAISACTLLRFERRCLVKIPEVSLKLYRNLAVMLAERLRDTNARVTLARAGAAQPLARCAEQPAH